MAVTGTEPVVLVLCTGGTPPASASASLARVRSATDCVVSLSVRAKINSNDFGGFWN